VPRIGQGRRLFAQEACEAAQAQAEQHFQVAVGVPNAPFAQQAATSFEKPQAQSWGQKPRAHHPGFGEGALRHGDSLNVPADAGMAAVKMGVDNKHGNSLRV